VLRLVFAARIAQVIGRLAGQRGDALTVVVDF